MTDFETVLKALGELRRAVTRDDYAAIADDAIADIARIQGRHGAAVAALRRVEWKGAAVAGDVTCPECLNQKRMGHEPDCALAAALEAE